MEKAIAYKASNGRLFESEEKCLAYEKKISQYPKVKESVDIAGMEGDNDSIRRHFTSYMVDGKVFNKEKVGYSTDKEAIERARVMNCRDNTIHKLVAYKCPICQKWHVGRNGKVLTEKEREHYRRLASLTSFNPKNFAVSTIMLTFAVVNIKTT